MKGYWTTRLAELGYPGSSISVRDAIEFAIEKPTAARVRTVGAMLAWMRLAGHDAADPEVANALIDFHAILTVERRWVAEQEIQRG